MLGKRQAQQHYIPQWKLTIPSQRRNRVQFKRLKEKVVMYEIPPVLETLNSGSNDGMSTRTTTLS
jgi:hypothetical protein